jgi:hypothetical protein
VSDLETPGSFERCQRDFGAWRDRLRLDDDEANRCSRSSVSLIQAVAPEASR